MNKSVTYCCYISVPTEFLVNALNIFFHGQKLMFFALLIGLVSPILLAAQDLSDLSLEDLAGVPVIENSKQTERLFDAPVSAFVFDDDDASFLPVDSVPEMLRYASGVHITRVSNGIWGLAMRGLSSRFLSRVLFTVDEQNIYSSLYSGLFGDQHDIFLPDVASIEIVHGPGGSLWGHNAMNGMINVIMKPAFETENTLMQTQVGSLNRSVGVRSGWAINDNASARVFVTHKTRLASVSDKFKDDWKSTKVGAQIDYRQTSKTLITLSSEAFSTQLGWAANYANPDTGEFMQVKIPQKQKGFNLQARWKFQKTEEEGSSLRSWIGYSDLEAAYADFRTMVIGAEWRSRVYFGETQHLLFNLGGTIERNTYQDTIFATFWDDQGVTETTGHAGVEYTNLLIPDRLELSAGVMFKDNSKTTNPYLLPTVRALYKPNQNTRFWASYAKGQRDLQFAINNLAKMQVENNYMEPVQIPTPAGMIPVNRRVVYASNPQNMDSEQLHAIEVGVKHQLNQRLNLKLVGYRYLYKDIYGTLVSPIVPVLDVENPYLLVDLPSENTADGTIRGVEFSAEFKLRDNTTLELNYSHSNDDFKVKDSLVNLTNNNNGLYANSVPAHLCSLRWIEKSANGKLRSDLGLRYTSETNSQDDENFQADYRLTWTPNERFRISAVGRNLLKAETTEPIPTDVLGFTTQQPREWYLEATLNF